MMLKKDEFVKIERKDILFLACTFWQCARSIDLLCSEIGVFIRHPEHIKDRSLDDLLSEFYDYYGYVIERSLLKSTVLFKQCREECPEIGGSYGRYRMSNAAFYSRWFLSLLTNKPLDFVRLKRIRKSEKVLEKLFVQLNRLKSEVNENVIRKLRFLRRHLTRCSSHFETYLVSNKIKSLVSKTEHFGQPRLLEFLSIEEIIGYACPFDFSQGHLSDPASPALSEARVIPTEVTGKEI